jgi:hypothetical protein
MNREDVNLIYSMKEYVSWTQLIKKGLSRNQKKEGTLYDDGHQCDNMTTNISKSFNHVLKKVLVQCMFML